MPVRPIEELAETEPDCRASSELESTIAEG
jgi:hypothetical protein